jgi:hypothetical protein
MWQYQGKEQTEIPNGMVGFVYLITDHVNGKKYIGKKLYHSAKQKVVAGKKKKFKVESDWKKYYGSNDLLKAEVKLHGAEHFTREILHQCAGKGESNYWEAFEQFTRGVLLTDEYYNGWINCKITEAHVGKLKKSSII